MKKKTLLAVLSLLLVLLIGVSATLAYLTDTDSATNTFTVGNVEIDLIESQLHRSNASGRDILASPDFADQLVAADDYSAKHGWTDKYYPDSVIQADAENYAEYLAENGSNMIPGSSVHKMPYVINTGKNDAYVRVRVLVPVNLFVILDQGPSASYWTTTAMNKGEVVSKAVTAYNANTGSFYNKAATEYIVTREGVDYYEFDFTYTKALAPDEMTFWNCWGNIAISENATSKDLAGVESFNIIVEADAIQAQGFADYKAAFTAFDKQK